jgi:hypothetical protein
VKGDLELSFEAIILNSRELETEVDLLVGNAFEGDYSMRIKLCVYSSSMTDDLLRANLTTVLLCLFKLTV